MVATLWDRIDGIDDDAIDAFVTAAVPAVLAGQSALSLLTEAYLIRAVNELVTTPIKVSGLNTATVTGPAVRGGVDLAEVYRRAHMVTRWRLSEGDPLPTARAAGRRRATVTAATDMQLAEVTAAQQVLSRPAVRRAGITRWQRRPGAGACGLCVVAATRTTPTSQRMALHATCHCIAEPTRSGTPEAVDVDEAHARQAVRTQFGEHAADTPPDRLHDAVALHQHNELGPVLTVRGHHFKRPRD